MTDTAMRPIRRALLSVSDKSGIVDLARALVDHGVEILSTGNTHRALKEAGIAAREVAQYTGFPEMMDGRVKTLHPKIHGGILGRRGTDDAVMAQHAIEPIDLVVVNLYPFEATIARPDTTAEIAVENIDIGGPAMVRSAAKNHADVLVVVDPNDYDEVRRRNSIRRHRFPDAASLRGQSVCAHGSIRRRGRRVHGERRWRVPGRAESAVRQTRGDALRRKSASTGGAVCGPRRRVGRNCDRRKTAAGQGAVVQQRCRHRRRARVCARVRRTGVRDRQTRQSLRRVAIGADLRCCL